jgi:toxin ParE1/3/4
MLAEAHDELRAAAEYYHDQRAGLGNEFLDAFAARLVDVLGSPERFARVKTRGIPLKLRQANLERFPYSVIFYSKGEFTVVVAVAHHKRRPNYWRRRLKS